VPQSAALHSARWPFIRNDGQIFKVNPNPEHIEVEGNFKAIEGTIGSFPAVGNGLIC
jgi:hypothetical protein